MDNVPESIYNYRINKINLKDGTPVEPGRINVFVGANNCGKTQLLKDMLAYMTGSRTEPVLLTDLDLRFFRNYPFLCFPTYLSFASNKRFLQRPYIVRFIIFNRLFVPSTKPLL